MQHASQDIIDAIADGIIDHLRPLFVQLHFSRSLVLSSNYLAGIDIERANSDPYMFIYFDLNKIDFYPKRIPGLDFEYDDPLLIEKLTLVTQRCL